MSASVMASEQYGHPLMPQGTYAATIIQLAVRSQRLEVMELCRLTSRVSVELDIDFSQSPGYWFDGR